MIYKCSLPSIEEKLSERQYHVLGDKLLSFALYEERGIVYEREDVVRNYWGKPRLKRYSNIHYNITHSNNLIMCAIADVDVGIDVEKIRKFNYYAALKVCSEEELNSINSKADKDRAFFKHWTLKESYVKAIGVGISYSMKEVNFVIKSNEKICCNKSNCSFRIIEDSNDYIAAICLINY